MGQALKDDIKILEHPNVPNFLSACVENELLEFPIWTIPSVLVFAFFSCSGPSFFLQKKLAKSLQAVCEVTWRRDSLLHLPVSAASLKALITKGRLGNRADRSRPSLWPQPALLLRRGISERDSTKAGRTEGRPCGLWSKMSDNSWPPTPTSCSPVKFDFGLKYTGRRGLDFRHVGTPRLELCQLGQTSLQPRWCPATRTKFPSKQSHRWWSSWAWRSWWASSCSRPCTGRSPRPVGETDKKKPLTMHDR